MANMDYCRFQNTSQDMEECLEALINRESLSKDELKSAKGMIMDILEFFKEESIIDTYNIEYVNEILSECKEK